MVAAAKQEAAAILAEARATAEKMTAEAQAARDELLPERDSMIVQAALIRSAAERQVETLREEQQRVHASIESMRGRFGSCSSSRGSRSSSSRSTARSGSSTT